MTSRFSPARHHGKLPVTFQVSTGTGRIFERLKAYIHPPWVPGGGGCHGRGDCSFYAEKGAFRGPYILILIYRPLTSLSGAPDSVRYDPKSLTLTAVQVPSSTWVALPGRKRPSSACSCPARRSCSRMRW